MTVLDAAGTAPRRRHPRPLATVALAAVLAAGLAAPAAGTPPAPADTSRGPVEPEDYGRFEDLGGAVVSEDGRWLAYRVERVDGKDELRVRSLGDDDGPILSVRHGDDPVFSRGGRRLAFSVGMSEEKREALREKEERPRDRLGLLELPSGDTTLIENVRSFAFDGSGRFLALHRYPPRSGGRDEDGPAGSDVVVRDLETGTSTHFGDVAEFAWREGGSLLAMAVRPEDADGSGLQLYDAATGRLRTLASREAIYRDLRWRTDEDDLAALRALPDTTGGWEDTTHAVMAWRGLETESPRQRVFDPGRAEGFPDSLRVTRHDGPRWAEDGRRLFFGVRPRDPAPDGAPDGGDGDGEEESWLQTPSDTAGVLVWHWKDVDIVPRQQRTADRDRRRTLLVAWDLETGDHTRVTRDLREEAEVLEGDSLAAVVDPVPYREERRFGPRHVDVHVADVATGERRTAIERVQYFFGPSPGGRYLLYLEDDHYHTYEVATGRTTDVTEGLDASFVDLEDDHTVEQKPPYGTAGWSAGDEALLAYSEHDVWRIAPDGSSAANLTRSLERGAPGDSVRYRHVDLEDEEDWERDEVHLDRPVYFSLYDEWREMHGFARLEPGADEPERLVWEAKAVGRLERADDAGVYLFTEEDFSDSPDWFVAGPDLDDPRRVTQTNPFLDEYAWGRAELIEYESRWGERLQGALFYPAEYEPGETYPMITYIYETRSPRARYFVEPTREHPYNTSVFTAEGYFVWQPDITYRDRNPGRSAVAAIVPSVRRVLETGRVDSTRVGLVGHSWGGYQTAFTVTQTDLFRAAVAGAPLTNLVSMYHSIYWRTGGTDARIFEISQGRMEVPPYRDMDAYVANSPLHHVRSLETPLLTAFGTEDGAVEFNQGVEFYNAARRAGKPLVMLTYEGENHGLSKRDANTMDYRDRVLAWFDHWLRGAPDPGWIGDGVDYLEIQEEKEERAKALEDGEGG